MATSVVYNGVTYSIPAAGEVGWASLSNFLIAVANNSQTTGKQIQGMRTALTSPVAVATTDYGVVTNLTTPGAVSVVLPSGVNGQLFAIFDGKGDAATNNITITGTAQNIRGAASLVISANYGAVLLQFSTTDNQWEVLSEINVVPLTRGGTGAITAAAARTNIGLGNVDNTSDATKNAAVATLTNKTIVSPVITTPTGIVKGDVGLGNVDNTSDATKNAAVATLTNKTITSPVITSPTGIVKGDVGLGNLTNDAQLKIASNLSDVANANTSLNNILPTQTGNAGRVLGTDATNSSWIQVATVEQTINAAAGSSTATLGSSNDSVNIFNPTSADIDVTLNNTYLAGRVVTVINTGTKNISLKANDAAVIRTIYPNTSARVISKIATPTTNTSWSSLDRVVSDWITLTNYNFNMVSGTSVKGASISADDARYRRLGQNIQFIWNYKQTSAGSGGSGAVRVPLPNSLTIDLVHIPASTTAQFGLCGSMSLGVSGTAPRHWGTAMVYDSTNVGFAFLGSGGGTDAYLAQWTGAPFGAAACGFGIEFTVPVSGWTEYTG